MRSQDRRRRRPDMTGSDTGRRSDSGARLSFPRLPSRCQGFLRSRRISSRWWASTERGTPEASPNRIRSSVPVAWLSLLVLVALAGRLSSPLRAVVSARLHARTPLVLDGEDDHAAVLDDSAEAPVSAAADLVGVPRDQRLQIHLGIHVSHSRPPRSSCRDLIAPAPVAGIEEQTKESPDSLGRMSEAGNGAASPGVN